MEMMPLYQYRPIVSIPHMRTLDQLLHIGRVSFLLVTAQVEILYWHSHVGSGTRAYFPSLMG